MITIIFWQLATDAEGQEASNQPQCISNTLFLYVWNVVHKHRNTSSGQVKHQIPAKQIIFGIK